MPRVELVLCFLFFTGAAPLTVSSEKKKTSSYNVQLDPEHSNPRVPRSADLLL